MSLAAQILHALEQHPGQTMRDLHEETGIPHERLRAVLGVLHGAKGKKLIRIVGYRRDSAGGRLYPRALYALGNQPDAPKPEPLTKNDYKRRWRERCSLSVNSVFQLGRPARGAKVAADWRKK